jgi:hypothetical protein
VLEGGAHTEWSTFPLGCQCVTMVLIKRELLCSAIVRLGTELNGPLKHNPFSQANSSSSAQGIAGVLENNFRGLSPRANYTERPPVVGEDSANFLLIEGCRVVSAMDPLRP